MPLEPVQDAIQLSICTFRTQHRQLESVGRDAVGLPRSEGTEGGFTPLLRLFFRHMCSTSTYACELKVGKMIRTADSTPRCESLEGGVPADMRSARSLEIFKLAIARLEEAR